MEACNHAEIMHTMQHGNKILKGFGGEKRVILSHINHDNHKSRHDEMALIDKELHGQVHCCLKL